MTSGSKIENETHSVSSYPPPPPPPPPQAGSSRPFPASPTSVGGGAGGGSEHRVTMATEDGRRVVIVTPPSSPSLNNNDMTENRIHYHRNANRSADDADYELDTKKKKAAKDAKNRANSGGRWTSSQPGAYSVSDDVSANDEDYYPDDNTHIIHEEANERFSFRLQRKLRRGGLGVHDHPSATGSARDDDKIEAPPLSPPPLPPASSSSDVRRFSARLRRKMMSGRNDAVRPSRSSSRPGAYQVTEECTGKGMSAGDDKARARAVSERLKRDDRYGRRLKRDDHYGQPNSAPLSASAPPPTSPPLSSDDATVARWGDVKQQSKSHPKVTISLPGAYYEGRGRDEVEEPPDLLDEEGEGQPAVNSFVLPTQPTQPSSSSSRRRSRLSTFSDRLRRKVLRGAGEDEREANKGHSSSPQRQLDVAHQKKAARPHHHSSKPGAYYETKEDPSAVKPMTYSLRTHDRTPSEMQRAHAVQVDVVEEPPDDDEEEIAVVDEPVQSTREAGSARPIATEQQQRLSSLSYDIGDKLHQVRDKEASIRRSTLEQQQQPQGQQQEVRRSDDVGQHDQWGRIYHQEQQDEVPVTMMMASPEIEMVQADEEQEEGTLGEVDTLGGITETYSAVSGIRRYQGGRRGGVQLDVAEEEYQDKDAARKRKNRNICLAMIAVAVCIGAIVGLAVALTGGDEGGKEGGEDETTTTTTSTTTSTPSMVELCQSTDERLTDPFFQLRDQLVADGISLVGDFDLVEVLGGEDEWSSSTAQRKALCWLSYGDGLGLTASSPNLAQRYTLAVLYHSLTVNAAEVGLANGLVASDWLNDTLECEWDNVGCLSIPGRVTSLDLRSSNLQGTVPEEVGRGLPVLENLLFENNKIGGEIPESFKKLSLKFLHLNDNQFFGSVFDTITAMQGLESFFITNNHFNDTIPTEIGLLSNLRKLDIAQNNLKGSLVSELGTLESLEKFSASDNRLTGTLPPHLGNLTELTILYIYNNLLEGNIPEDLGKLKNLEQLKLQENDFVESVPSSVCNLRNEGNLALIHVDCRYGEVVCDCCYNPTDVNDPDNECF